MDALKIVAGILLLIACILLIVLFLLQNSKQSGMNALNGGSSDSYFSRNKNKTLDAKILSVTRIMIIVFFALTVALNIFVAHLK